MYNVQCLVNSVFYTAKWGNTFSVEERARLHIKNIMLLSNETFNSTAYIAKYNGENNISIVIKEGRDYYTNLSLAHEAYIGLYAINTLRVLCPNFMYTYGLHEDNKFINNSLISKAPAIKTVAYLEQPSAKKLHLFLDGVDNATSFFEFMLTNIDVDLFLALFMQVLYALEIAQHKIKFTHYDLHLNNILINDRENNSNIVFHFIVLRNTITNIYNYLKILDFFCQ